MTPTNLCSTAEGEGEQIRRALQAEGEEKDRRAPPRFSSLFLKILIKTQPIVLLERMVCIKYKQKDNHICCIYCDRYISFSITTCVIT